MKKLPILLLLLFCSIGFAGIQWTYSANAPISHAPASDSTAIYFSSEDAKAHAVSLSGRLLWSRSFPSQISTNAIEFANGVAFGTSDGTLNALDAQTGRTIWQAQLNSTPVSLAVSGGMILAATDVSLSAFSAQNGALLWSTQLAWRPSSIGVSSSYVLVAHGDFLGAFSATSGKPIWFAQTGGAWNSAPIVSSQAVYIGSTDGSLYSLLEQNGQQRWSFPAGGWAASTPTIGGSYIYFGSNNGYVYSVDTESGLLRWKYKTGEAVWAQPLLFNSAGSALLVAGSNDKKVYVLDAQSGAEKISFAASDWVTHVLGSQSSIIIFSRDGKVTSLSLSPSCSIKTPQNGALVGDAELEISGQAFSNSPASLSTSVRINNGQWVPTSGKESWTASIDVSGFAYGPLKIECSSTDSGSTSASTNFASTVVKSPQAPLLALTADIPASVKAGSRFTVSAYNSKGAHLRAISVYFNGQNKSGNSPLTLEATTGGMHPITISKPGYQSWQQKIEVQGDFPLVYLLVPLLLIAAAFVLLKKKKTSAA